MSLLKKWIGLLSLIFQVDFIVFTRTFLSFTVMKIKWLNKEISLETEMPVYDGLTFVANFGGTLGLFDGFSFFMLWDLILPVFERCKQIFKLK